jgi:hypothetical protein
MAATFLQPAMGTEHIPGEWKHLRPEIEAVAAAKTF